MKSNNVFCAIWFLYIIISLSTFSCISMPPTIAKDSLTGVWFSDGKYYKNYLIVNFKNENQGVFYILSDQVSFKMAEVSNKTLSMNQFSYELDGNTIVINFTNKGKFTNKFSLKSSNNILYFKNLTFLSGDSLDNQSGFTFKKLQADDQNSFLKIESEKSLNNSMGKNITESLRNYSNLKDAISGFLQESKKYFNKDYMKTFLGYSVDYSDKNVTIYIKQPNPYEDNQNNNDNTAKDLNQLSFRRSPDIKLFFEINNDLGDHYFKFPNQIFGTIESTKGFLDGFIDYLKTIKPSQEEINKINNNSVRILKEQNKEKYIRLYDVLDDEVPGNDFKEWVLNTRDIFVNEFNNYNQRDAIIMNYYNHSFTNNGQVISRELLYKMTISSLGNEKYSRLINTVSKNLQNEGYYDSNTINTEAQTIGILIFKKLCKLQLEE